MNWRRKLVTFLVAMCVVCSCLGLAACGKGGGESSNNPNGGSDITELLLSKTELQLDVYDEVTLSVLTEVDGAITWSSSDVTIATVSAGKVTALKEGVATITASLGELQATCKVTIINSYTAPVIKIDQKNVGVEIGEELPFSSRVLWKGEDISAQATYVWALNDNFPTDVVELTEGANGSVSFKGLNYGTVEYTVTVTYRDITVAKTITVHVSNLDVVFESENLLMENGYFKAKVAAANVGEHSNSMTPQISVYDGDVLSNEAIVWTAKDPNVANIVDGNIVGYKTGSTMLVGTTLGNTVKIQVEVYRPQIKADETVFFAQKSSDYTLKTHIQGNVESVLLNSNVIANSLTDGKITYSQNIFPASYKDMGQTSLTITTDCIVYSFDAWLVTQAIYTENDLNSFMADNAVSGSVEGYFVLANDITCQGSYASVTVSFKGIFNGLGHKIGNFHVVTPTCGMFNIVEMGAVVENILFTNAVINGAVGGLLGYQLLGNVNNIYAEIVAYSTYAGGLYTGALFSCTHVFYGEIRNTLVDVTKVKEIGTVANKKIDIIEAGNLDVGEYVASQHYFGAYIIGEKSELKCKPKDVAAACVNYSKFYEMNAYNDTWNTEFWTAYNGMPYPKNLPIPQADVITENTLEVMQGKTFAVNVPNSYIKLSKEAIGMGVEADGNLITVPETVAGNTVLTLEVYSVFTNQKAGEISVTVLGKPTEADYKTRIYAQDATGEYILLDEETHNDKVGKTVEISSYTTIPTTVPLTQEYSGGYTFNANKSNVSGTVADDGSLVLAAYYDTMYRYKNIPSEKDNIVKNGNTYMLTNQFLYNSQPMYQMFGTYSDVAVITVEITAPVATILNERDASALDRFVGILAATNVSAGTVSHGSESAPEGYLRSVGFNVHPKGAGICWNGLPFYYAADNVNSGLQHPLNKPVNGVVQSGWQPFAYSGDKQNGYTVTDDTVELTVVLYNNRFYIFVDDAFCTSKGFEDYAIATPSGKTGENFEAGAKFVFGVWMTQTVGYNYTIKVTEEAYDTNATALLNSVDLYKTNVLGITNTASSAAVNTASPASVAVVATMDGLPADFRKYYL